MQKLILSFIVTFFFCFQFSAQETGNDKELRTLVTLLSYISKDYAEAVQNGEIVNEFEFAEMQEFSGKCLHLHAELTPLIKDSVFGQLKGGLKQLELSISNKKDKDTISAYAQKIKNDILNLGILTITPNRFPSISKGAVLFQNNCVSCHGEKGKGDGPMSKGLSPAPSNLTETQFSPLEAYNVIKLGIEGTGMASYDHLSENEMWNLAFYVVALKHPTNASVQKNTTLPSALPLDSISQWTDTRLQQFIDRHSLAIKVGEVRNFEPEEKAPLDITLKYLDMAYTSFQKGDLKQAEAYAFTSYLEGFELTENILSATSPELVRKIEKNMIAFRAAIQENNATRAELLHAELLENISEAKQVLSEKDYSFAFIYGSALSILIREALEALLIILIVVSVLKSLKANKSIVAVHLGWVTAVLAGVIGWYFIGDLINLSGASRELMEGTGALLAVLVLLFAGVWLHSHSEVSKWTAFIKNKVNAVSRTGNQIGLFLFSFVVVFREAFEVVLFLSALKLNNPEEAGSAINWALITSVGGIIVFAYLFLTRTKKLPISQFFKLASYMIAVLAVVLSGKGIMAFQEAGYIPTTPIDFLPRIDILGFYPNLQSIGLQIVVLCIILFFNWRNRKSKAK